MSTNAFSAAGTKIYISAGVPATIDSAGFGALTYTEIKDITDIGGIGAVFALITHVPLGDGLTYKFKGVANTGQLQLKGAYVKTDPGQVLLTTAANARATYAIKIVLADTSILYVQGQAMGIPIMIGNATNLTTFDCNFELSGTLVIV